MWSQSAREKWGPLIWNDYNKQSQKSACQAIEWCPTNQWHAFMCHEKDKNSGNFCHMKWVTGRLGVPKTKAKFCSANNNGSHFCIGLLQAMQRRYMLKTPKLEFHDLILVSHIHPLWQNITSEKKQRCATGGTIIVLSTESYSSQMKLSTPTAPMKD